MSFPIVKVNSLPGVFEFKKCTMLDTLRNRHVKRITSDRSIQTYTRASLATTSSVDVRNSNVQNPIDETGVRITKVLKGVDQHITTDRTVTFQGNASFLPAPFIIDTANNINVNMIGVAFSPVYGVFNAFNDTEPSLGLTLTNTAFTTGAITVKDQGLYSVRFIAELIIPTVITTDVSFYIDFLVGQRNTNLRSAHSIFVNVPAGTDALRTDVTAPNIAPFYDVQTNFFVYLAPDTTLSVLVDGVTLSGDGQFNINTVDLKICMIDAV